MLVTVTGTGGTWVAPMSWGEKVTWSGEKLSEGLVVSPWPLSAMLAVSPVALAVNVPGFTPKAWGVKVTGTETDWPDARVTGRAGVAAPMLYAEPDTVKDE